MHETSLGRMVQDYITGEELEETSYEEFRQATARMLVEERGYPRESFTPRVPVVFPVKGEEYCRMVDFVVTDEHGSPVLLIFFVAGQPGTYDREVIATARIFTQGAVPLVAVTDSKTAYLYETATGECLARDERALPRYSYVQELAKEHPAQTYSEKRLNAERRILYAYSEFIYGSCCASCTPESEDGLRGGKLGQMSSKENAPD